MLTKHGWFTTHATTLSMQANLGTPTFGRINEKDRLFYHKNEPLRLYFVRPPERLNLIFELVEYSYVHTNLACWNKLYDNFDIANGGFLSHPESSRTLHCEQTTFAVKSIEKHHFLVIRLQLVFTPLLGHGTFYYD